MPMRTVLTLACICMMGPAAQAEITPTVGFSLDYFGKYVWRGQNLTDEPVLQPGASVGLGNLSLGIWGNLETTNVNNEKNAFTEVDYTLDYSDSVPGVDGLGYSVGLISYDFPEAGTQTYETYLGVNADILLSPTLTAYYDYDDVDSWYVSGSVGHSFADILGPESGVSADLSASLGWGAKKYNNGYWGVNSNALNDITLGAAFPFAVGPVSVTPSVNYIILADSDIKGSNRFDTDNEYFFAGIGISMEF